MLLKPSPQTPLTAERLALALERAGLPQNILHVLHLSPALATFVIQHPLVNFVSFTGSVVGGRTVEQAAVAATGFKGVALEVGPLFSCVKDRRTSFKVRWEGSRLCQARRRY